MNFTGERFVLSESNEKDEIYIEHLMRYKSISEIVKDKIVLDAATGDGYGAFILSSYAKKVTGIDISNETITYAKNNYYNDNLNYLQSSIEKLPFEDSVFDVIVSFETIEHVNEEIQNNFMREIRRVLKEDGILIISTPDKKNYSDLYDYKNEFHVKEFYENEWQEFISKYFKYYKTYYQNNEIVNLISDMNDKVTKNLCKTISQGKYLVSICSDKSEVIQENISGYWVYENLYITYINEIIKQNEQIQEVSNWGQELQKQIVEKDQLILKQNEQIQEVSNWATSIKGQLDNNSKELDNIKSNFWYRVLRKLRLIK